MQGVGNVYRCEVLWATELSPWALVADLSQADAMQIVNTAARLIRSNQGLTRLPRRFGTPRAVPAVYGRCGQACPRCRDSIESRPTGRYGRMLYWCPGCQTRHDRRAKQIYDGLTMDPHPAATHYLNELRWREFDPNLDDG